MPAEFMLNIKKLILAAYRHCRHTKGSHTMIRIALGVPFTLENGKKGKYQSKC